MRLLIRPAKTPPTRNPGRRRRRRLALAGAAGLGLLLLCGGAGWFVRSGRAAALAGRLGERLAIAVRPLGLEVENVAVEGRERSDRAAILKALDVTRGTPILAVDLEAAKRRLEALTWVRAASVERRLPDTIYVHLAERQPLAFWQRDNKLALIDRAGKVVAGVKLDDFSTLIVLVGADAPAKGAGLIDMLGTEPALARHVTAAVLVGDRRWNLRFDNGVAVALPEIDPESAWHRLAELERKDQLLQRNILAVDMRLPDRLVVRVPPEPKSTHKKNRANGKAT